MAVSPVLGVDACPAGLAVHAEGPAAARVRIASAGSDAVSVTLADDAGRPVASIAQFALRPLPAAVIAAAEALFQVGWTPARTGERQAEQQPVAVLGEDAGVPTAPPVIAGRQGHATPVRVAHPVLRQRKRPGRREYSNATRADGGA